MRVELVKIEQEIAEEVPDEYASDGCCFCQVKPGVQAFVKNPEQYIIQQKTYQCKQGKPRKFGLPQAISALKGP
jgi:hypothetical protein